MYLKSLSFFHASWGSKKMKAHRIRKAKSLYKSGHYHNFVEVEKNRWIEIESLDNVTYESIQTFLSCEKETGIRVVGFTDKSFQHGTIKDWFHSGIIKNLKIKE